MRQISCASHRFPACIIQHAVWLYFRFALSYRDVEDKLAERRIDASYETVRRWVLKFGRSFADRLERRRPRSLDRWHLDEVSLRIGGKTVYLWRDVDDEGEVLDVVVQSKRDRKAALKSMRKVLKRHGYVPDAIVTDRLAGRVQTSGSARSAGRWQERVNVSRRHTNILHPNFAQTCASATQCSCNLFRRFSAFSQRSC